MPLEIQAAACNGSVLAGMQSSDVLLVLLTGPRGCGTLKTANGSCTVVAHNAAAFHCWRL
jgi:hypothetical protein